MKRFLSLFIAICLALGLGVPALAETGDMEDELTSAAARVKDILEIDDGYTAFSGSHNDGLRPGWNLDWSDESRELSVTMADDGPITEVYRWQNDGRRQEFYGFDAHFPAVSETAARSRAEYWLARLMGEGESARVDGHSVDLTADGEYRFTGRVLKNGLDSPVSFVIRIGGEGLRGFYRSDGYGGYVGGVPDPKPAVKRADAAKALADAAAFELYYVTDESGEARLRYVPVGPYTVVDGQTGEVVDMDALYASFGGSARDGGEMPAEAEASMAADAGMGRGLTEVELSSIANYKDARSREDLDKALRALPHIGLEDFGLDRCSYVMDEDGSITARLRYSAPMDGEHLHGFSREAYEDYITWGDAPVVYKYVTMDAKTGTVTEISTSYPLWDEDREAVIVDYAQDPAEAFLRAAAPDHFSETALCALTGLSRAAGETFARLHDGYFFPENYLYVALDPGTGTVDEYRCVWDEDAVFASSRGIVDEARAKSAYIAALDLTLGYVAWPEDIDYSDPVLLRYADWGYTFVESLRLGYYYSGRSEVSAVDALTGEPVRGKTEEGFVYDDLTGVSERDEIEALGRAGVGFGGGSFRPEKELTRRDALTMLLQAAGDDLTGWDDEMLKNEAVWRGLLPAGEWDPDGPLTGTELVRMMLGASRYGAAAELTGVWAAEYRDDGYAAAADALGLGDVPAGNCTRGSAAALLYAFMTR